MKTRRITLLIAAFSAVSVLSGAVSAKDDARIPALKAAESARFQASVDADAKVLGRLLDDGLEYVHSNGDLDSKTSFIESLTSGKRDYVAARFEIQSVRVIGDVAIIRGTAQVTVADNGQSRDLDLGYTDVWVWKDKHWRMTAWRSARMPNAQPVTDMNEAGARASVLARYDAALHGDLAALDRLLGDDLDYCTFRGECQSKQQYLGEVRSGRLRYQSITPTITRVKMAGENSTVLGRVAVTATRDGVENTVNLVYLAVLQWRDGRWQMISFASALPYEKKAVR